MKSYTESSLTKKDQEFECSIRPKRLKDFQGQEKVIERLTIATQAAKLRGEPLHHALFFGPPGLGKTTLAAILAEEMGSKLVTTSGPSVDKAGDLAGILTSLEEGDVLFIDEIHRLNRSIEEYLYPAMEDFSLDLMLDQGPSARSVQVKLAQFTLIGATTRVGLISAPMRSRFGTTYRLDFYQTKTLSDILVRSGQLLGCPIDGPCAEEIARRARGTPRIANNLLRWVRDFSQIQGDGIITLPLVKEALNMLSIDEKGLDEMDMKLLTTMIDHYEGGPVGLKTLSAAIGEEGTTIEEVIEPFLIMLGFINRTPRGRVVTDLGLSHLKGEPSCD